MTGSPLHPCPPHPWLSDTTICVSLRTDFTSLRNSHVRLREKKTEETHPSPSLLEDIVGSITTSTVTVMNKTKPVPRLMAIRKFTKTPSLFEVCQGPLTETVNCIFPEHMPSCHGRETAPKTSKLQRVHSKWNTQLSPFLQSPGEDPGMLFSGSTTNTKKRVTAHYLNPRECRQTLVHWL